MSAQLKSWIVGGLLAAGLAVAGAVPAKALIVDYTYSGTFDDGNVVTGSFRFDSVAETISNGAFTSTGGTTYPAKNFSQLLISGAAGNTFFAQWVDPADGPDLLNDPVFAISFFTDGNLLAPLINFSDISRCGTADCVDRRAPNVFPVSESLTGVAVPLPPTVLLLGGALAGIAVLRRRKA